jgi:predicted dehydrogenase
VNRIRWGLVGAGDIAVKRVAPALATAENSELVAVSRRQAERAEEFARSFGAQRWYATWEELVRDDGIDAVYVATPVHLHAPIAVAAAEAGKHVLCEKPMALDLAECDRMIAAADASGVRLGIAYYRHFYPVIARIRELLASGAIGAPVVAQINAFEHFDPAPAAAASSWQCASAPASPPRSAPFPVPTLVMKKLIPVGSAVCLAGVAHAPTANRRPSEVSFLISPLLVSGWLAVKRNGVNGGV